MLTPAEKRFIRSWEDQRKGGRWPYIFLYFIAAFVITNIMIFVTLLFLMGMDLSKLMLWLVPSVSVVVGLAVPMLSWNKNEKRWKMIIRREIGNSAR